MKFGRNLHQYMIPEWEYLYLDYNGLKQLIQSASVTALETAVTDINSSLGASIDAIENFRKSRNDGILKQEKHLYTIVGIDFPLAETQTLNDQCHVQLLFLQDGYERLLRAFKKLRWFDRVNEEACGRLFAKLQSASDDGVKIAASHERRWLSLLEWLRYSLSDFADRCEDSTHTIRQILSSSTPQGSSCFHHFPEALHVAVGYDDPKGLAKILRESHPDLTRVGQYSPEIFNGVFRLSALHQAYQCLEMLFSEIFPQAGYTLGQDALGQFIELVGIPTQARDEAVALSPLQSVKVEYRTILAHTFRRLLGHIGTKAKDSLMTEDTSRCFFFHRVAAYGLKDICQVIIDEVAKWGRDIVIDRTMTRDNEGRTAFHCALTANHVPLMEVLLPTLRLHESATRQLLGELLYLALRHQYDDIVTLLLRYRPDLAYQSSRGEISLFVSAKIGRLDYVVRLLDTLPKESCIIETADHQRGWPPLFAACVEGHVDVVKLLLKAGTGRFRIDRSGWTAKEHAAFRGHLDIASLFSTPQNVTFEGGPATKRQPQCLKLAYQNRPGDTIIVINLGSMQDRIKTTVVNITCCSSEPLEEFSNGDDFFSLEVSVPSSQMEAQRIVLPLFSSRINEPLVFTIAGGLKPTAVFKIIKTGSEVRDDMQLVGSGVAMLEGSDLCLGALRQSMIREGFVPILDKNTLDQIGTVSFTYTIGKPYPYLQNPRSAGLSVDIGKRPLLVGHRGHGMNLNNQTHLQLGENTVESFLSAAKVGASFVELTRDRKAIIYHDFSLSESGTDVPIDNLTCDQFMYASNIQSPHGNPISLPGKPVSHRSRDQTLQRSRSVGGHFEYGALQVQDRIKHTLEFSRKGFKQNTRGDFIQGSFATLEELLVKMSEHIGFNIEMTTDANVAFVSIVMNTFTDTLLDLLQRPGGKRQIVLSSFTPDICILLSVKQRAYPVMFITNAGKPPPTDLDFRAASLQVAVKFCKRWNLAGVVFASDVFVLCPRLIRYVKRAGIFCGSYGPLNNIPEHAKVQAEAGLDILITDKVGLIARTLEGNRP